MAEFLELLESVQAKDADVRRMFGGEGSGSRTHAAAKRLKDYPRLLAEAAKLVADVVQGRQPMYRLQEAMSTSDFPLLFGDIIDRQLLAGYREAPAAFRNFVKISTVKDFRLVSRFTLDGAEGQLAEVPQGDEYPEAALTEGRYQYKVLKYGRRIPLLWETLINDDLESFNDVVSRLGKAARRTEAKYATGLYVDANGPHAGFFKTSNKNRVHSENFGAANNPPLSIAALQQAMAVLAKQVDADGEPITIEAVELVVPPALQITAQNILNATQLQVTEAGGTSNQVVWAENWMRGALRLNVDPYIPLVASTANGSTSWFLFASIASGGRPALEMGFLRGHTEPETFIKAPNAIRVGGGEDPLNGDFENDSVNYKVRHVFGGTQIDPKMAVASNGSGA